MRERSSPKRDWKGEIASRWRGAPDGACDLCGCERSLFNEEAYFELRNGTGYWTCQDCCNKDLDAMEHLLYSRGCRKIVLINRENGSSTVLKVLSKPPWTKRVSGR